MGDVTTMDEGPTGTPRDAGRAMRAVTHRADLGVLIDRPTDYDPIERVTWQGSSRVSELLELRYQRMLANPLAFYRGAALLMAEDLARGVNTSLLVQICGDAHLENFGMFSSPERQLVFDVNDFDETATGPFEWDVKRLITSLAIASEHLGHDANQQEALLAATAREYQDSIRRFAQQSRLEVWYAALDVDTMQQELQGYFANSALQRAGDVIQGAASKNSHKAFDQFVTYGEAGPQIRSNPPRMVPLRDLDNGTQDDRLVLDEVMANYGATLSNDRQALLAQFSPVDWARQIVGIGSVGLKCFVILLTGRDEFDPFLLQVKEAQNSVVDVARGAAPTLTPGERVVHGQKLMQATHDIFLGWHSVHETEGERSYYVRQLYDHKTAVDVSRLDEPHLRAYGRVCAWVLARAHARTGNSREIAGYLGKGDQFSTAMMQFALAYRDRNLADYHALSRAVKEGRISVATK